MHEADEQKYYLLIYRKYFFQNFFRAIQNKNNPDFTTMNQLGNSKKSHLLFLFLQQNFRMLLKSVLNGVTIKNLIGFVFALIKVNWTVSDLITNYLFMKLKEKQNTTNFHIARTLQFTSWHTSLLITKQLAHSVFYYKFLAVMIRKAKAIS